MQKSTKPAIEAVLNVLRFMGSLPVSFGLAVAISYTAWSGAVSPLHGVVMGIMVGLVCGAVQMVSLFAWIIEMHPEQVMSTVTEWKADGRWAKLLDSLQARRAKRSES